MAIAGLFAVHKPPFVKEEGEVPQGKVVSELVDQVVAICDGACRIYPAHAPEQSTVQDRPYPPAYTGFPDDHYIPRCGIDKNQLFGYIAK